MAKIFQLYDRNSEEAIYPIITPQSLLLSEDRTLADGTIGSVLTVTEKGIEWSNAFEWAEFD